MNGWVIEYMRDWLHDRMHGRTDGRTDEYGTTCLVYTYREVVKYDRVQQSSNAIITSGVDT